MAQRKKKLFNFKLDIYLLILGAVSILFLGSVVRYSLKTYLFPQWDEQYYMYMASTYWRLIQAPSLDHIYQLITFQGVKQMGYPLMILPSLLVFGLKDSYFLGLFTNGLLYIATIFGVYFTSKNYLSKLSSFVASIIFACYSWTLFHVHFTYSETASSATIIWTIYFLIKSNLFRHKIYSIVFGLFFGFAILTRWIAPVFIAGPLFYVAIKIIKEKLYRKKIVLTNLVLIILGTLLLILIPNYINRESVFSYFYGHRFGGEMWQMLPGSEKAKFSLFSLTFYLNTFSQLGIYFFGLIIAGFILALKKPRKLVIILLAAIVSWFFFSFFSILKTDRFIIPIFPYLAILSASIFDEIRNKKLKFILIFLTLILSLSTFLYTDWGKGPIAKLKNIDLPIHFGQIDKVYLKPVSRPPYIYKISANEIIQYLVDEDIKDVIELFYYKSLNEPMMTFNLYNQAKPVNIISYLGTVLTKPQDGAIILNTVLRSKYLMIKNGIVIDETFPEKETKLLNALTKLFEKDIDIKNYYTEKKRFWIYQDSSELIIYQKKIEIPEEEYESLKSKLIDYLR